MQWPAFAPPAEVSQLPVARHTFVGCAGWNVPKAQTDVSGTTRTHLQRYSAVIPAVEINSSFYRPHRRTTYARWRASVPDGFRFSVKVPKIITHEHRLQAADDQAHLFLESVAGLEEKLGCLLVQLPPSLAFDRETVQNFLSALRDLTNVMVACEPRHASWFSPTADDLLKNYRVARVAADPACVPAAARPGGSTDQIYYRLHGSPRVYYSNYDQDALSIVARRIAEHADSGRDTWCIFDNTAVGAAFDNARTILTQLSAIESNSVNGETNGGDS
ncbi:MAG TPA: DUF72 domain-containing protein [Planctomycetaceae bacterium]|nr:DUF72 domain-containing protein [Planctomycetaceae bacterium]